MRQVLISEGISWSDKTMITCPKCGFEQPPDRYCANCGIDLENYAGKKRSNPLKPSTFVFLGVAILLIVLIAMFGDKLMSWDLGKIYPETQIIEDQSDSKFGVSSQNLRDENAEFSEESEPLPAPETRAQVPEIKKDSAPDLDFKVIPSSFHIGEITDVEINQLMVLKENPTELDTINWGMANEIPLIRRGIYEKEMRLNLGENKFNYEDEFTKIDFIFEVISASPRGIKAKLNYTRSMDGGLQVYASDESGGGEMTVPYDKTVYVIDRLPRLTEARNLIISSNSLLSLFHKSRTFIDETSECIFILQFQNPFKQ